MNGECLETLSDAIEFAVDITLRGNIIEVSLNAFRSLRIIFLFQTTSKLKEANYINFDQLLFRMIHYFHNGDSKKFFELFDDHLSNEGAVNLELLKVYRLGCNNYKHFSTIPAFAERIFENILLSKDSPFFAEGQRFVLMAVAIECLANNHLSEWFKRLKLMNERIESKFEHNTELKENQFEIFVMIAIHQNHTRNIYDHCPFLLDVERTNRNKIGHVNLRRFNGQTHKLRVLWYLVNKIGSKRWAKKDYLRMDRLIICSNSFVLSM